MKERQIEALIEALPGIDADGAEQVESMRRAIAKLEAVHRERQVAEKQRRAALRKVERILARVGGL